MDKKELTEDPGSKAELTTGQAKRKDGGEVKNMKPLTDEQRRVLKEGGTEAPFSGKYLHTKDKGMYKCAQCGATLFSSDKKFDSKSGWPSFDEAIPGAISYHDDSSHGMKRTEVRCSNCNGHLGHVFDDGPEETTGKRYCINSVCLELEKENGE